MSETVKGHKAKCKDCGQVIISKHGGDYVACDCGNSAIDTDRWFPDRVRLIGNAEFVKESK